VSNIKILDSFGELIGQLQVTYWTVIGNSSTHCQSRYTNNNGLCHNHVLIQCIIIPVTKHDYMSIKTELAYFIMIHVVCLHFNLIISILALHWVIIYYFVHINLIIQDVCHLKENYPNILIMLDIQQCTFNADLLKLNRNCL